MPSEPALKELHEEMLILLKWFHKFCMAHDIKYSLHGGTLLGAVREQGFIPWDDDVDVSLMREEYERLMSFFNRCFPIDTISMQYYDRTPRLVMKRTDRPLVWMDVFIYDYISEKRALQIVKIFGELLLAASLKSKEVMTATKQNRKYSKIVIAVLYAAYLFGRHFSYTDRYRLFDTFCTKSFCGKKRFVHLSNDQYSGLVRVVPQKIFNDYVITKFEDTELMIMRDYKILLPLMYGSDYMVPRKFVESNLEIHQIISKDLDNQLRGKNVNG